MACMSNKKIELSRRHVLGGLGTIGVASAGAGLGTSAFFSDEETFADNQLTAGALDLKVDWEEHYSDWSDDEQEGLEHEVLMEEPEDPETYVGLPDPRDPLIWVHEDDLEQFMDNTAIEAFPDPDNDRIQDPFAAEPGTTTEKGVGYVCDDGADTPEDLDPRGNGLRTENEDTLTAEDQPAPLIDLDDVKPGDFGEVTFSFHLCDNPGYVWMNGVLQENAENGMTEPESKDPDENGGEPGELGDTVRALLWYDDDGDNVADLGGGEVVIAEGTLREVLEELSDGPGIPLDGNRETEERDCYENSTTQHIGFAWWLPLDHGNEVQTDSVSFDLGFYTEQCRHNDGSGICACGPDEVVIEVAGEQHCITPIERDLTVQDFYNYGSRFDAQVNNPAREFAEVDTSVLLVYRNTNTGDLSLVMIHDRGRGERPVNRTGGAATFDFSFGGITPQDWDVQDDPPGQNRPDTYWADGNGVIARTDWSWSRLYTDGGAFSINGDPFKIEIDPAFNEEAELDPQDRGRIEAWKAKSGDGEEVELLLDEPCTIYPCDGQDLPLEAGLEAVEEMR